MSPKLQTLIVYRYCLFPNGHTGGPCGDARCGRAILAVDPNLKRTFSRSDSNLAADSELETVNALNFFVSVVSRKFPILAVTFPVQTLNPKP